MTRTGYRIPSSRGGGGGGGGDLDDRAWASPCSRPAPKRARLPPIHCNAYDNNNNM